MSQADNCESSLPDLFIFVLSLFVTEQSDQCASNQFFPLPQSAIRGMLSWQAEAISSSTSCWSLGSSFSGTEKFSSSCT